MPSSGDPISPWLEKRPRATALLVALMLAFFAISALIAARTDTPTVDEFVQLPMGLYYLKTGRFDIDRRNPPLVKVMTAAPLLANNVNLDTDIKWRAKGEGWWMWFFGTRFMRTNPENYFDLFFAGRAVNVLIGTIGALLAYLWARSWLGSAPALGTLLLYCTTPALLGHAAVATLDTGVTVFLLAGFMALHRLAAARRWPWALGAGALFGCALASKFVTLLFLPLIPILLAAEWRPRDRNTIFEWVRSLALIALGGWLAVCAAYGFKGFPLPQEMTDGILFKTLESGGGKSLSFLMGIWSTHGWWYYYLVAFFFKSTIPTLLLLTAAAAGWIKRLRSGGDRSWIKPALWLALPPLVLIEILSIHYQIHFGIRYLLPAFPFLIVLAGYGIQMLLRGSRTERRLLTGLLLWQVAACVISAPGHLAYFNESAGGLNRARKVLLDSNLDWGQDLGRLKAYMARNNIGEIRLGYYGCVDPKLYRISYSLPPFEPEPGLYAISANYLGGLPPVLTYMESSQLYAAPGYWSWFEDHQPVDRVGSSIFIFKISEQDVREKKALSGLR